MNKHLLKQTIIYLNEFSLDDDHDLVSQTVREIKRQDPSMSEGDVIKVIHLLQKIHALEWLDTTLDMFPSTVIFSKANPNTDVEALAAYEIALRSNLDLNEDPIKSFLKLTTFYDENENIRKELCTMAKQIENEIDQDIVSETLNIIYTESIIKRKSNLEYRNQNRKMINFDNQDFILERLPQRGIPVSREATKDLQSFFKDTQMHEFDHACPICHIKVPQLLIASHIKPFRDCAHIYETATHDNGLLLCRNHDFLFDQGYISFNDDGTIIISKALIEKDPHLEHFNFDTRLDPIYMTKNRRKFLKYHRENILKR